MMGSRNVWWGNTPWLKIDPHPRWVSGGTNPPLTYKSSVACTLIFTNGNSPAKVSASGEFNMVRPNVIWKGGITAPVTVDTNYIFPAIHLGNLASHTGMTFNNIKLDDWGNFGAYSFVQLVDTNSVQNCQTSGQSIHISSNKKDGNDLVSYLQWLNTDYYVDPPGAACHNGDFKVSDSGSYQAFLMFQPSGGIAVPLKLIKWNWSGVATSDTNGNWTLISSNAVVTANNQYTTTFPIWTNVVGPWPANSSILTNNIRN